MRAKSLKFEAALTAGMGEDRILMSFTHLGRNSTVPLKVALLNRRGSVMRLDANATQVAIVMHEEKLARRMGKGRG